MIEEILDKRNINVLENKKKQKLELFIAPIVTGIAAGIIVALLQLFL